MICILSFSIPTVKYNGISFEFEKNLFRLFSVAQKQQLSRSKLTQRSKFLNFNCDIIGVRKI